MTVKHYAPRELRTANDEPTGKWHYTCQQSDGTTYAIGNCSPFESCPDCVNTRWSYPSESGPTTCAACGGKGWIRKLQPCPGHDTPQAACEHQKEYYLATVQFFPETPESRQKAKQLQRCAICDEFTCGLATWGPGHLSCVVLCNAHCSPESLAGLVQVGDSLSSY